MKEAYVSFKIAKLLKEKGFPQSTSICNVVYKPNGKMSFNAKSFINPHYFFKDCYIFAPTQQMACGWLKEEKNIYVTAVPDIGNSLRFYPAIYVIKGEMPEEYWFEYINSVVKELNKSYGESQQAIEAALEYVLTNLI